MVDPMESGHEPVIYRSETRRRIAQSNLKRCPLCNALNARVNRSCFVCDWHGAFDHDPFRIEESLIRMIYHDQAVRIEADRKPRRKGLLALVRGWLGGRVDLTA